ncbi:hypothetical protein Riv7116_4015 [Rivularia sp. PCC 7116]|nr:hypothetical protein [Rivularia sp. PCC 7116]AFY56455.1 hypothetical protein Riv7116_4015 [Rivularia sp. PCC 7116]
MTPTIEGVLQDNSEARTLIPNRNNPSLKHFAMEFSFVGLSTSILK